MFNQSAIQVVRFVAWLIAAVGNLAGVGLVCAVLAAAGGTAASPGTLLLNPLTLAACGLVLGTNFVWAVLMLQAMNAANVARLADQVDRLAALPAPAPVYQAPYAGTPPAAASPGPRVLLPPPD